MCNMPGSTTRRRLHNQAPSYIARYPDAKLVILSCPVMQPAKLPGCLTIRSCCLEFFICLNRMISQLCCYL